MTPPIDKKKKGNQQHHYGLISRLRNNDPRTSRVKSRLEWLITARSRISYLDHRGRAVVAALAGATNKHFLASMAVSETRMSLQLRGHSREEERVDLLPDGLTGALRREAPWSASRCVYLIFESFTEEILVVWISLQGMLDSLGDVLVRGSQLTKCRLSLWIRLSLTYLRAG